MTLLETERLGRKISELLQQTGNPEIAPKLAADYAAACHAANLRLQQCEAMIKAGDRPQAIQLAETAPNLLDLVTVLEFRGSDEWRIYCPQNSLPVADRIDARAVIILNECYAQGITTDHPLYAAYRSAVLNRNDEDALKTLQSITRLNPADTNASSELARIDAKVLAARLQHLGSSLQGAEPALVVREIEAIEACGFKNKPADEVWCKAQAIRCGCLLQDATVLKKSSHWLEVLGKLDFISQLQKEFKVELPGIALKQLDELQTWARGEQEKDRKEREFQSLIAELHHRIQQSEEKDTSARYVKLPELRDDYEGMHKVWNALIDFTRPIPDKAASGFRKRSALLEAEIVRRTTIQRRIIFAGSAFILMVGAVTVWIVLGQMKTRDFSRQLQEAVAQRKVRSADKLLERAHSEKIGNDTVIASAETFSTREHALLTSYEAAFDKLPRQLSGEPDAGRLSIIADQLALAHIALAALAPDLKAENEPRLQTFEQQWQNYLAESGGTVNELFGQWISSAESKCAELDYRAPLEKTRSQIIAFAALLQKISDTESGFAKHLNLRNDLLQRAQSVQAKFATYNAELQKLDGGMAAINKAQTIKEFSDGINLVVSSEFMSSSAATAASVVQSLNTDDQTTLRILLGATDARTWAFIGKPHPAQLVPEVVMPAERQTLQQLNNDPAVGSIHQRYRLGLDQDGKNSVEWITAGALETSTGWKQIMAWVPSPSATSATFEDHDYGYFDGHYKLSPTQPVYHLELLNGQDETASFNSVGLEKVLANDDTYAKPLLEVLDSIKNSHDGSSLFRAYLFLRLVDLMDLQPDGWGLTFCPVARAHAAQIRSIVGNQLSSGDWFVPAKVNAFSQKLSQFFSSVEPISYAKQARGLLDLAEAASKDGLRYVGFVDLDGKPKLMDNSIVGEVFGYSSIRKQPIMLSGKIEAGLPFKEPALPLSPLFALSSSSKDYLMKAGVNPEDASFRSALPRLFQAAGQP